MRSSSPSKAAALELQEGAEDFGIEFNDHYLGKNADGTVTVTVFGSEDELALSPGPATSSARRSRARTWEANVADMKADPGRGPRGDSALGDPPVIADDDELVILRAGLLRELRRPLPVGRGEGPPRRRCAHGIDLRRAGDVGLLEHGRRYGHRPGPAADERQHRPGHDARHLRRAPQPDPDRRHRRRPCGADEDPHRLQHRRDARRRRHGLARRRPAAARVRATCPTSRRGTWTRPRSGRFDELAAEFSNIAEIIPCRTRRTGTSARRRPTWPARLHRARRHGIGRSPGRGSGLVLTSRAWGHEGGNRITAEFLNPGVPTRRSASR